VVVEDALAAELAGDDLGRLIGDLGRGKLPETQGAVVRGRDDEGGVLLTGVLAQGTGDADGRDGAEVTETLSDEAARTLGRGGHGLLGVCRGSGVGIDTDTVVVAADDSVGGELTSTAVLLFSFALLLLVSLDNRKKSLGDTEASIDRANPIGLRSRSITLRGRHGFDIYKFKFLFPSQALGSDIFFKRGSKHTVAY
jgi:hypothetical protein